MIPQENIQDTIEYLVEEAGYEDVIDALRTLCMVWADEDTEALVHGATSGRWGLRARVLRQLLEDDRNSVEETP
jgi:hypothetical protein